uniref:RHS repeat-associated core domain-containing protein n=1 Tax=Escherichia coli TaxID=562 RepID=UPI001FCE9FE9
VYQSYRLPGQQHDEESGLYYNRNRYYDPLQGRYITQDPIGLRGEWNLYKCSCPLISRQGLYLKLTLPADVDILA